MIESRDGAPFDMAKKKAPGRKRKKAQKPPPQCRAILLCERTILEEGSKNLSLISIFDGFHLPEFPGRTRPFTVFLQLVNGDGCFDVAIEVHDLENGAILGRVHGMTIEFPGRSTKVNMRILVPPLPLAHAGLYDFVVLADGREIDRQQFVATSEKDDHHVSNEE